MSKFDNYLASVNGVAINVDGQYGAQCWDLWSHYAMNMFGASMWATSTNSGGSYHHPGYTCEIWHNFGGSPIRNFFDQVTGTPQRGDVAIWEWGAPIAPNSHIAIVVSDAGSNVYTMTQNPGASHYAYLSKAGILGYLRPKNQSIFGGAPAPAPGPVVAGSSYTVVSGDSLSSIGARVGLSWQAIYNANVGVIGSDPNRIFPGQVLTIPGGSAPAPSGGGRVHTVVSGDTLWGISEAYYGTGTEWPRIYEANSGQIANPNLIFPGQQLTIP